MWRASYRVVLDRSGEQGQLQGWALIHNDTDESWRDVQIELANRRPRSFSYPLAEPLYAERELVTPEEDLRSVPQLAGRTVGDMLDESYGYGSLGLIRSGAGGGSGAGIGHGHTGSIVEGRRVGAGFGLGDLATLSRAEGHESGVMFVYRSPEPLDLDAHHSALVPIVQDEVVAESITWFEPNDTTGQAAARVVNSTARTWPGGTVSLITSRGGASRSSRTAASSVKRRWTGSSPPSGASCPSARIWISRSPAP